MSEPETTAEGGRDKRAWAEEVLAEILQRMGVRVRLEVKDLEGTPAEEGRPAMPASISVALHPDEDIPGLHPGKRSQIADSLQFLVNKIVNRGADKRWINIGVGAHPEPRLPGQKPQREKPPPREQKEKQPSPPPTAAAAPAAAPAGKGRGAQQKGGRGQKGAVAPGAEGGGQRAREPDERTLEVADDPVLTALGATLAQKAATLGRFYAVTYATLEDRAQLVRGAKGATDVTIKLEGEGRSRRVVFVPANPKPMPKKAAFPDYDVEDDLDDGEGED